MRVFVVFLMLLVGMAVGSAQPPVPTANVTWAPVPNTNNPCSPWLEWRLTFNNVPPGCIVRVKYRRAGLGFPYDEVAQYVSTGGAFPSTVIPFMPFMPPFEPESYEVVVEYRCPTAEGEGTWQTLFSRTFTEYPMFHPQSISASVTGNACEGTANATITVSSPQAGKPPYTYVWSDGGTGASRPNLPNGNYTVTVTDSRGCQHVVNVNVNVPPKVSISVLQLSNVTQGCPNKGGYNGSISIAVSGGTPPYSISWDHPYCGGTSCNNLPPGTYTATITDANGCQTTQSFTVLYPNELRYTVVAKTLCDGRCVYTATAEGGTPPYRFAWSQNQTVTSNTSNTSTAIGPCGQGWIGVSDAAGCRTGRGDLPASSGSNGGPSIDINMWTNCEGNCRVNVRVTGAVQPVTVTWDDGSVGGVRGTTLEDCDGPFSVTVVDAAGCSTTLNGNGSSYNPVGDSWIALDKYLNCNGDCVYIVNSRVSGNRTITWTANGITQSANGNRLTGIPCDADVAVSIEDDDGCVLTASKAGTVPAQDGGIGDPPRVGVRQTLISTNPCRYSVEVYRFDGTSGEAGWSFAWSTGATTQSADVAGGSTVTVTITDENGCEFEETITVFECPPEKKRIGSGQTSPQRVSTRTDGGLVYLDFAEGQNAGLEVSVIDMQGAEVYDLRLQHGSAQPGQHVIDLQSVPTGVYLIKVSDHSGLIIHSEKILIVR